MKEEPAKPKKIKGAAPDQESAPSINYQDSTKTTKWQSTLKNLLRGARHRFDAERWGDHALHSTVSSLERTRGISFDREWRSVPTRFGKPCRVVAYWVAELSRVHAMRLVAKQKKRGNSQ